MAACDASGRPVQVERYDSYGPRIDSSSGLLSANKGADARAVIEVYSPHSTGGTWGAPAEGVAVVDPTPRTYEEAMAIASQCPRGKHTAARLTVDAAKALVADHPL